MSGLTTNQKIFASALAKATGLNPQAVGAWELGEENNSAAAERQAAGNNDWLNIGYTDSGQQGTGDNIWSNPETAAQATAGWIQGKNTIPGYGTAAEGIQDILDTRGQSPAAQLAAVSASPWASSHYGGASALQSLLPYVGGVNTAAATVTSPAAKLASVAPVAVSKQPSPTSDLYNTLSSLEAARQQEDQAYGISSPSTMNGWDFLKSMADGASQSTASQPGATTSTGSLVPAAAGKSIKSAIAAADTMAANKYNYEWGGGHNSSFSPTHGYGHGSGVGTGYDCSGAVSAILHSVGVVSSPMVAQQYMTFGKPGAGTGPNDVTIYASPVHVFMKIGGKYFGTSYNNPGGGAGWFANADTTGFVARHVTLGG